MNAGIFKNLTYGFLNKYLIDFFKVLSFYY